MTLEAWNIFFQVGSVGLLALTFLFGTGAFLTGRAINKRQALLIATTGERSAEAERKAAEASEGTARALADVEAAKERTSRLELEAAKQREKAATAERALLELQERVKPRRLTDAQRTSLVNALRASPVKGPVTVVCVLGDGEGLAFARQIDEILKAAGWPSTGVDQASYTGHNPVGLGITVHSAATAPRYGGALQRAFAAAGMNLWVVEQAALPEGRIELLIGNKPQ